MATTVRTLLKSIAGLFALAFGGVRSTVALEQPRETLTWSSLITRLRRDVALHGRFSDNPRAVLLEYGIDPTPYNLPDRMSAEQMNRLLAQFTQAQTPGVPQTPPAQQAPAPVYGPPPGPPPSPTPQQPAPEPPAVVYGPPPGMPKK